MTEEQFTEIKTRFLTIEKNNVKSPSRSVENWIAEFRRMAQVGDRDKEQLVANGLDLSKLTDLQNGADALSMVEGEWSSILDSRSEAKHQWQELSPLGFELTRLLGHKIGFAVRNIPSEKVKVDKIKEGSGNDDMIQDLMAYYYVGKANTEALEAVHIDLSLLDKAKDLSMQLGKALGMSKRVPEETSKIVFQRNQAYTFTLALYNEVREFGKYVFWEDPDKLNEYNGKLY